MRINLSFIFIYHEIKIGIHAVSTYPPTYLSTYLPTYLFKGKEVDSRDLSVKKIPITQVGD